MKNFNYPIDFCLYLIQRYIFVTKNIQVKIILNLDIPKEKELFEKACAIVLALHEDGKL